jgi:hypothetical protein
VTLAVLLYRAQPLLINVAPAYTTMAAYAIAIAGAIVILAALSGHWRNAPLVIALAAVVTLPAVQYGALSSGGDDTVRQMARLVQQNRQSDEAVGTLGVFVRNLVFYSGIRTERVLMVAPADQIDRLEQEHGLKINRLAELLYFNEAGVRVRTLLWPDRARDLTRVLLVSNR